MSTSTSLIPSPALSSAKPTKATSTKGRSRTSHPETLDLFASLTSSQALDCGRSQDDLPDGPTTSNCGLLHVHVSRSRRLENASEPMIQGICGRTYIGSYVPASPLASWESRLRERLATLGSTESALIWREKVTPAGRSISRLSPSTRHSNGTGSTGSPWATPTVNGNNNQAGISAKAGDGLGTQLRQATGPAPIVADMTGGRKTRSGSRSNEMLLNGLMTVPWCAPSARDWKDTPGMATTGVDPDGATRTRVDQLPRQMSAYGASTNGSSAETGKRGAPNPEFACWLMGWPEGLISGAWRGIRSFRNSRRKSSPRSSKQSEEAA